MSAYRIARECFCSALPTLPMGTARQIATSPWVIPARRFTSSPSFAFPRQSPFRRPNPQPRNQDQEQDEAQAEEELDSSKISPWFLDSFEQSSSSKNSKSNLFNTSPSPPTTTHSSPPPFSHDLPTSLSRLHSHLVRSPFFDPNSITFLEPHPQSASSWCVVVTLKRGRETGIRGATESIRQCLLTGPPLPDSPSGLSPQEDFEIEGIAGHYQRGGGGNNTPTWVLLHNLWISCHIMTEAAREVWSVEQAWDRQRVRSTPATGMDEDKEMEERWTGSDSEGKQYAF